MKLFYTSRNHAEVGLLKTILEQEGIVCNLRNDALNLAMPYLLPELWVVNEADYDRAADLIVSFETGMQDQQVSWVCKQCGETNEGQFGECWHCSTTHEVQVS